MVMKGEVYRGTNGVFCANLSVRDGRFSRKYRGGGVPQLGEVSMLKRTSNILKLKWETRHSAVH